jgi:hypothetical protein
VIGLHSAGAATADALEVRGNCTAVAPVLAAAALAGATVWLAAPASIAQKPRKKVSDSMDDACTVLF